MQISPYLNFNGRCEEAFKLYEQRLGGKIITKTTYEETPMADQVPSEWRKKIIHASIKIGDLILMGADSPPENYDEPKGISLTISVKDPAEAERIFSALSVDGTVRMPLQQTFWAASFGMLVDQFGIPWMVNCEQAS